MAIAKVSELQGVALDWAVGKVCSGHNWDNAHFRTGWMSNWRPSTDWSHGGPLIENYRISIECIGIGWIAEAQCRSPAGSLSPHDGDSLLEAACRAIVSANLGDEIDVPDELIDSAS